MGYPSTGLRVLENVGHTCFSKSTHKKGAETFMQNILLFLWGDYTLAASTRYAATKQPTVDILHAVFSKKHVAIWQRRYVEEKASSIENVRLIHCFGDFWGAV